MGEKTLLSDSREAATHLKGAAQRAQPGRRWRATEEFFLKLAAEADAAHAAGQDLTREALAEVLADAERSGDLEQVEPKPSPTANR